MKTKFGNRQKQSLFVFFLILAGTYYVHIRRTDDAETQIRKTINTLVDAAEEKKIGPFKKYLSENFQDNSGRNRDEALNLLRLIFLRHPKIELNILSLKFLDNTDEIKKEISLTLFMSENILPQDKATFFLTFKREGGSWRRQSTYIIRSC